MDDKYISYDDYKDIKCPHCEEEQNYEVCDGELSEVITFWGEEGAKEFECNHCEKNFFINEFLMRTFEVAKTEDDFDY